MNGYVLSVMYYVLRFCCRAESPEYISRSESATPEQVMRAKGVQNGEREKSGDRRQETEWGRNSKKHSARRVSRMRRGGVQNVTGDW